TCVSIACFLNRANVPVNRLNGQWCRLRSACQSQCPLLHRATAPRTRDESCPAGPRLRDALLEGALSESVPQGAKPLQSFGPPSFPAFEVLAFFGRFPLLGLLIVLVPRGIPLIDDVDELSAERLVFLHDEFGDDREVIVLHTRHLLTAPAQSAPKRRPPSRLTRPH